MDEITVGVLTVSDRCYRKEALDESGPNLVSMIENGVIKNGKVVKTDLVPDDESVIKAMLNGWCEEKINLILTTGGTGVSETDTTPEATLALSGKPVPGLQHLILRLGLKSTPFAALSRVVACVVEKSLIINLPGSTKAAQQCLEAAAEVIPHAVDLITGRQTAVERVHGSRETKRSTVVVGDVAKRSRNSPYECITVASAQRVIMDRINFLKRVKVLNWKDAHGHVLAEDVSARDYLPACDVSIYDGYAVLSSDTQSVKKVSVTSIAGDLLPDVEILPGYCARVNTGAAIPPGADAVVPVEKTKVVTVTENGKEELKISVNMIPKKGFGVRKKGMDHALGQRIMASGTYIDSSALGLLAAAGVTSLKVFEKPQVAVLSTGNEIVECHETLPLGKVRDSNRITLITLLKEEGFQAVDLGIAVDEPDALRNALEKGFRRANVVVTTGSMSMGERDFLKEILVYDFNADICFGRVLMKPGKPTSFAVLMFEGKPKVWFGLPGNPASAFVTSHLFLLPALRNISGYRCFYPLVVKTTLQEVVPSEDRPQYVRGVITYNEKTDKWNTQLTGSQISSRIGNCVNANCLVLIPQNQQSLSLDTKQELNTPSVNSHKNSLMDIISSNPSYYRGESKQGVPGKSNNASGSKLPANTSVPKVFSALLIDKVYFPANLSED